MGYPECDFTKDLSENGATPAEAEVVEGRTCPECSHPLHVKTGRYGRFIGCSHYPACKFIEPLEKPVDTAVTCPKCRDATIVKRKSKKGKIFYSCAAYPKCDYALWNEPIDEACPSCAWPLLTVKETKRSGRQILCPQQGCGYTRDG